jgi:hypothetical protein
MMKINSHQTPKERELEQAGLGGFWEAAGHDFKQQGQEAEAGEEGRACSEDRSAARTESGVQCRRGSEKSVC